MTMIEQHTLDDVYATAVEALGLGFSVVPPAEDGTKRPGVESWKRYQESPPTVEELDEWYEGTGRTGVGVVCGAVSGGLEMLEFEGRARALIPEFRELCQAAGLDDLLRHIVNGYREKTPSGGVHLLYRCPDPEGNTVLARDASGEVTIETRGEGGYVVTAPSFGDVHPTGKPWSLVRGGFESIATISAEERRELHRLCRTLDRAPRTRPAVGTVDPGPASNGLRPGDDYNGRATWAEILEPRGWVPLYTARDGNQHWRRPGKDRGTSATVSDDGTGVLYVFTSSAPPFEPGQSYSPFGALALLDHGGDFSAAARALAAEGYGERLTAPTGGAEEDAGDTTAAASDGYRLTDVGNSERLIRLAGGRLRYAHAWGKWLIYRGGRWVVDEREAIVTEFAKKVPREIMRGLAAVTDADQRKFEFRHAIRSESGGAIASMVRLARGADGILVDHEDLDADPCLLNVRNGTVDLRTGKLRPHDPADLMTLQCRAVFEPAAAAPLWEACLLRWQPDPEIRRYLQARAGACATGRATETLDLDIGTGANGKSKFHGAIQHTLGPYSLVPHKSLLVVKRHEQHDTVKAALFRKRLVVAGETKSTDRLDEEQVKSLTGGDRLQGRRMREDPWEFQPSHTLILFSNYTPTIQGTDESVWRRVRLVRWPVTIPEDERDDTLDAKLRAEAPGILRWIVEGARLFLAEGLVVPDPVRAASAGYRTEQNVVGRFIAATLTLGIGELSTADIKRALEGWCDDEGITTLPRLNDVAAALEQAGCRKLGRRQRSGQRGTIWAGVTLANGNDEDQGEQPNVPPLPPSSVYPSRDTSRVGQSAQGGKGGSDAPDVVAVDTIQGAFPGATVGEQ